MESLWWYLARASGLVAWVLLTTSVVCGILIPAKLSDRQRPAWLLDLHRWVGGLTVAFLALHLMALVADSFVHFDLLDLLVPFAASYRPAAVALGVIATWLLVAVQITSLLKDRLPRRVWRRVHLGSYGAFFLTTLHGILAGTDAASPAFRATTMLTVTLVVFVTVFRVLTRRRPRAARARRADPTAAAQ